MKSIILISLFLFANIQAFSQGKHAKPTASTTSAGQTPPAGGTPSPSGASVNAQTGYSYRLRYHYHIRYGALKIESKPMKKSGWISKNKIMLQTTLHKDTIYKSHFGKAAVEPEDQIICKDCKYKTFKTVVRDLPKQTLDSMPNSSDKSNFVRTDIYIDSVSRYWNTNRKIFSKHRLRVSVTQADSGKLQIVIYANNFPKTSNFPSNLSPDTAIDNSNGELECVTLVTGKTVNGKDFAKPISASDSAQNFYLQINNKWTLKDPISYLSLPFVLNQYGAMTIPFKYRWPPKRTVLVQSGATTDTTSATSESTASINVAAYFGRKWGRTRFYYDPTKTTNTISYMVAGFVGPSLISLTANNIDSSKKTTTDPSSLIAFSIGGSLTLEWKSIDFGLFGGWDIPLVGKTGWVYRDKFWVGFGIGVNLGLFTSGGSQGQSF